jgi:hypothetical protein
VNVLIIGGTRHGEWIDVLDGSTAWVDIRTADTYRIRNLGWEVTRIGQGGAELTGENYRVPLAVHPDLTLAGPEQEQEIVTRLLQMLAMNAFIRAHGEPVATEPVPDTPAGLFGPDGSPL